MAENTLPTQNEEVSDVTYCDICNMEVPSKYLSQHSQSAAHAALLQLANRAAAAVSLTRTRDSTSSSSSSDSQYWYCTKCNKVTAAADRQTHEWSDAGHQLALKRDRVILNFYAMYSEPSDTKALKELESENLSNEMKEMDVGSMSSASTTRTSTADYTELSRYLRSQVLVSTCDEDRATVSVSRAQWHGIFDMDCSYFHCHLCGVFSQELSTLRAHIQTDKHVRATLVPVDNKHCIREYRYTKHCIICNTIFTNVAGHIARQRHADSLLKYTPENKTTSRDQLVHCGDGDVTPDADADDNDVQVITSRDTREMKRDVTCNKTTVVKRDVKRDVKQDVKRDVKLYKTTALKQDVQRNVKCDVTPNVKRDVSRDKADKTPDAKRDKTTGAKQDVQRNVKCDVTPNVKRDVSRDKADKTPDAKRDKTTGAKQDVQRNVKCDVTPNVKRDVSRDKANKTPDAKRVKTTDVTRDVKRDVKQDEKRDVTCDETPDVKRDPKGDVKREVTRDVKREVTRVVTPQVTREVTREVTHEVTREVTDTEYSSYCAVCHVFVPRARRDKDKNYLIHLEGRAHKLKASQQPAVSDTTRSNKTKRAGAHLAEVECVTCACLVPRSARHLREHYRGADHARVDWELRAGAERSVATRHGTAVATVFRRAASGQWSDVTWRHVTAVTRDVTTLLQLDEPATARAIVHCSLCERDGAMHLYERHLEEAHSFIMLSKYESYCLLCSELVLLKHLHLLQRHPHMLPRTH